MKVTNDMVQEYLGIVIDYARDSKIPEQGLVMLTAKGFYKKEHEASPQETMARAATCYSFGDYEFAQRIYDYASKQHFVFASPVQTNAVEINWPTFSEECFDDAGDWLEDNVEPDGMPISCFLSMIDDSRPGLTTASAEAKELSMMGGGVGVYAGNRSPDEKSTGVMAHAGDYDNMTVAYRQTASRRGSMAMYMDITHPEQAMFMDMRNPTKGDENKKCFNLNHGFNIPDEFMYAVIANGELELVDPKHGPTGRKVSAKAVWEHLMETRFETGEPYMLFIDTVNRNLPKQITKPTYVVRQSNLCSEITLMTSFTRTAVCCLSSLNLEKYEEWKDTNIVADLIRLLDNVLEYFIRLSPNTIKRAINSATKERALGLGTLGWHSYLQSKMIPFESGGFNSAIQHTNIIHSNIKAKAEAESKRLGAMRGEAPDCRGSGFRNSHLIAIAPNASSASIVGASPSREPWASNAFVSQGRAGSFLIKNKYLKPVLIKYGLDTEEVWSRIVKENGSVQWIEEFTDNERAVFATAREIDPMWIVEGAAAAQPHVCQSISTNLFFRATTTAQQMSDVHIYAWEKGLKSLYYCRAQEPTKASIGTGGDLPLNAVKVKKRIEYDAGGCISCEG
jgi:ribonucleoside-diphosphate reductase alpha chain